MANVLRQPDSAKGFITRRSFLRGARYLGLTAATLPWLMRDWATSAIAAVNIQDISPETSVNPASATPPSTTSGGSVPDPVFSSPQQYGLALGINPYEQVYGFSGGEPVAQYLTGAVASDGTLPKKVSGYRYQDIVFHYLPIPGSAINTWLVDSLEGKAPAVSGHIVVQPWINVPRGGLSFTNAFVKEILFPEADSATGSPTGIRITLAAQRTSRSSGGRDNTSVPMTHIDQFRSLRKGVFSINIAGTALNEVSRVEPLVYSPTLIPAAQGGGYQGVVPKELSSLRIQLPETKAEHLYSWHNDFVVKGLNGDAYERAGTIRWMSSQDPLKSILTLKLSGLGILSVVRIPSKPGYVQAEMYRQKLVPEFF